MSPYAVADGIPMDGPTFVAWVFALRSQRVSYADIGARCGKSARSIQNIIARMKIKRRAGLPLDPNGYPGATPHQKRTVLDLARRGVIHRIIAAQVGISRPSVTRIIGDARLTVIPLPETPGQSSIDRIAQQNRCIFQMRLKGVSNNDIAMTIGISLHAVQERITRMRKRGLDIPRYPSGPRHLLTDAEKAAVIEMLGQSISRREVAQKMGVSRGTVNNVVWRDEEQARQPVARDPDAPAWTEGRLRYLRALRKTRINNLHTIANELNEQFPALALVDAYDVRAVIYGEAA